MAITDYKNKDTEKKDIKKASTEDIINLITTEYYTKKIEELETQLFNVRCGNPIYENGPIYTGEEKKKNEIRLESEIRKYEQILKEFIRLENATPADAIEILETKYDAYNLIEGYDLDSFVFCG